MGASFNLTVIILFLSFVRFTFSLLFFACSVCSLSTFRIVRSCVYLYAFIPCFIDNKIRRTVEGRINN